MFGNCDPLSLHHVPRCLDIAIIGIATPMAGEGRIIKRAVHEVVIHTPLSLPLPLPEPLPLPHCHPVTSFSIICLCFNDQSLLSALLIFRSSFSSVSRLYLVPIFVSLIYIEYYLSFAVFCYIFHF